MHSQPPPQWYPLSYSLGFMFRRKRLLVWSLILFLATIGLTTLGYLLTVEYVDSFSSGFLLTAPETDSVWGWVKHKGWLVSKWLFLIITRIVAFYFSFLIAYCLTTPGYVFLSTAAEKLHAGEHFEPDDGLTVFGILIDMYEGMKIALFGILVTFTALLVNFIPGLGQAAVFLLYTYYSALMFVDYPASRRRWSLGKKITWLKDHSGQAFRIGILPAIVSMVPIINIFFMSLLFPILTIHTTLNFTSIELHKKSAAPANSPK